MKSIILKHIISRMRKELHKLYLTVRSLNLIFILTMLATAIALTTACNHFSDHQASLDRVDTLLAQGNVDAAYTFLCEMSTEHLDSHGDMARYTLLKTETFFRKQLPVDNDSIDYAIFYYEQNGDQEQLARACYYKGVIHFFYRGNTRRAILLLKRAENLVKQSKNLTLKHKVYSSISYINLINKNYATAIKYARKAGDMARKLNNKEWIGYSLTYIANAYSGLQKPDSNLEYLRQSLNYYPYLSRENQSVLLSNISEAYHLNNDSAKAEEYIQRALRERPSSYTYAVLADFYIQRGELKRAHDCLLKAADTTDVYTYEKVLHSLFTLRQTMRDYQGATRIADTLLTFQKRQELIRSQNNIYDIQNKYEREEHEKQIDTYRTYSTGLLIILVLSVATMVLYHKYKQARDRRDLLQKHLLLNEYSDQLHELKATQNITNKELIELKKKVSTLKDTEVQRLSNGKILYESVLCNRNTIHWSNQDFLDFLEYIKLIDMPYVEQLNQTYCRLSPKQYLYLTATERMGKTEQEVGDILAIGPSSVRSIKSRIKSKRMTE